MRAISAKKSRDTVHLILSFLSALRMEILREAILVVKVSYPTDNNHILIVREEAHVQNLDLGQMLAPFIYVSYILYSIYYIHICILYIAIC